MDIIHPSIEVEVLMLESVLHRVARRELMLVLGADDDVPLRITTVCTRCLCHLLIIVVHGQPRVSTCIGHTGVQRATILKTVVMREAYGTVALA